MKLCSETFSQSALQMNQSHELHRRSIPLYGRQHTKHIKKCSPIPSLTSSAGACNNTSSNNTEVFDGISLAATIYRPKSFDQSVLNLNQISSDAIKFKSRHFRNNHSPLPHYYS